MDQRTLTLDIAPAAGKRVLVALSGGADSVALLLSLLECGVDVCAAHLEHGIRGGTSVADMDFCQALCARLGVPFYCERVCVADERRQGEGMEAAARRLRYAFLRRSKGQAGAQLIATAHHAGDQAETVLMHLLRGAGPEGAAGMRVLDGDLWRPLLWASKQDLVSFLRARGQDWREDESNRVADTPRNVLRLEILPRLERLYPGAGRALCRFAETQGIEDAHVAQEAARWDEETRRSLPNGGFWPLRVAPDEAILRRFWRAKLGGNATWERIRFLTALCLWPRGGTTLPDGRCVEKTENGLYILEADATFPEPVPLRLEGQTELPGLALFRAHACAPEPVRGDPFAQALSRPALAGATIRFRREGDWIRPLGMRGRKLLSDYLTDRKIDRPLRDCLPLIARGNEVLWAVGVGISETCALRARTEAVRLECIPQMAVYQYFFGGTKDEE